jgi:hypothetical protein
MLARGKADIYVVPETTNLRLLGLILPEQYCLFPTSMCIRYLRYLPTSLRYMRLFVRFGGWKHEKDQRNP